MGASLVTIGLLIMTHLPPSQVPRFVLRLAPDKVWHAAAYGAFAFLLYGGIRPRIQRRLHTYVCVVVIAAVMSALDELTQPLTGRNCEWIDFLAGTGGAIVGGLAAMLVGTLLRRRLR